MIVEGLTQTHPVQLGVVAAMLILNVAVLVRINERKMRGGGAPGAPAAWASKRRAYWALIASSVGFSWWLDIVFDAHWLFVPVKAYAMAFPLGLLDLHFSSTRGVPLQVVAGAALWCSTIYIRWLLIDAWFGRDAPRPVHVREFSASVVLRELVRFVVSLPFLGILSDLIFSPLHRLSHLPRFYGSVATAASHTCCASSCPR